MNPSNSQYLTPSVLQNCLLSQAYIKHPPTKYNRTFLSLPLIQKQTSECSTKIPGVKYFFNISYALGLITSVLRYKSLSASAEIQSNILK
jgi:hypothetical protein